MNVWSRKLLLDKNVVHIGSLVGAEDAGEFGEGLSRGRGGGSGFALVTEDGDRLCLDVGYTGPLRFVQASSQVADVREEDVHVDAVRQPFAVSEKLVYNRGTVSSVLLVFGDDWDGRELRCQVFLHFTSRLQKENRP